MEGLNIKQNNELQKVIVEEIKANNIYSFSDIANLIKQSNSDQKIFIESQDNKLKSELTETINLREQKYTTFYFEDSKGELFFVLAEPYQDTLIIMKSIKVDNN